MLIPFDSNPVLVNLLLFALAATGVWLSGTKLSGYVDLIAERTGIGKAFAGALFLGGATSLPEIATTITACLSGAAEMAGSNLLGGVVMQIAVLALVDAAFLRNKPLTLFSPDPMLLMQGVFLIFMLALAGAAIGSGELWSIGLVGCWPLILAAVYVLGLWILYRYEGDPRWKPTGEIEQPPESARDMKDAHQIRFQSTSTGQLVFRFSLAALGVLVSGFVVARSAEAVSAQTGIGQSFVGATLVALATSLPEVSTTWSAVRFGAYSMAAANILGTNSLEVALYLPADVAYRGGAIIDVLGPRANFLAALGILVTCVYLWGILERRDRTWLGMGYDSAAVLAIYLAGMLLFYFL